MATANRLPDKLSTCIATMRRRSDLILPTRHVAASAAMTASRIVTRARHLEDVFKRYGLRTSASKRYRQHGCGQYAILSPRILPVTRMAQQVRPYRGRSTPLNGHRRLGHSCPERADSVAKVPRGAAADFPLKDETSDNHRLMKSQTR
jgi:hypothetical protein